MPEMGRCEHCGEFIIARRNVVWVHFDTGQPVCEVTFASPA